MRHRIAASLALFGLLLMAGCAADGAGPPPGAATTGGFDSPEAALAAYLEGMRDGDLDAMLATFGSAATVEHYNYVAALQRARFFTMNQTAPLPDTDSLARELNTALHRGQVAQFALLQRLYLADPLLMPGSATMFADDDEAATFAETLAADLEAIDLSTIKILGFVAPGDITEHFGSAANQDLIDRMATVHGAAEMAAVVAVFTVNGETHLLLADAAELAGRWYLTAFGGNLGMLVGIGMLQQGIIALADLPDLGLLAAMTPWGE
ncbi:MAG: hypothetical protein FWG11_06110 [Promicromonosporaceae bacterium]|nr:hypothetical protein [Promicromonosporaceae bacterium]